MADVDMADATASGPVVKKKSGGAAEGNAKADSKKPRFEVKKECSTGSRYSSPANVQDID